MPLLGSSARRPRSSRRQGIRVSPKSRRRFRSGPTTRRAWSPCASRSHRKWCSWDRRIRCLPVWATVFVRGAFRSSDRARPRPRSKAPRHGPKNRCLSREFPRPTTSRSAISTPRWHTPRPVSMEGVRSRSRRAAPLSGRESSSPRRMRRRATPSRRCSSTESMARPGQPSSWRTHWLGASSHSLP